MTVIASIEPYHQDAELLDQYYGLEHPDPDELHDRELARRDRQDDHAPASPAGVAPDCNGCAHPNGPSPYPAVTSSCHMTDGRAGEGPTTDKD